MKKILLLATVVIMTCSSAMAQWNSDPAINTLAWPDGDDYYWNEMQMTSDGKTWVLVNYPNGGVCTALQLIDADGNWTFEEPLIVSEYPAKTFTTFGQALFVDRDDNAIVSVVDWRYSDAQEQKENHTVYKISPEGEFLWGEDGITLEGENTYDLAAGMSMCQLADGSYVMAWMHNRPGAYNSLSIEMQRLSADGEMLWNPEDVRMHDDKIYYAYPYVVDGGNNQVILVYAKGSGQDLYARKLDFDGTPVWSEDPCIYNGGWGSIPIWTLLTVTPSGDGGALITWNDDRYATNVESAFMAYLKTNGELGFFTENGIKLGYAGWRSLNVTSMYDPKSDSFYAMWTECSSNQSYYRIVAQRVNKEGELLWSEEGLEIKPMEETNYGYLSLQSGADDEMAFFYMRKYALGFGDVEAFVTTVNVNDTLQRRESEFTKCGVVSEKASLKSTPMYNDEYWVVKWTDSGVAGGSATNYDRLMIQRINNDLTLGNPDAAVEGVKADNNTFRAISSCIDHEAMFVTNMAVPTQATLNIYNVNGAIVATPFEGELGAGQQYIEWTANVPAGIYLATLNTANGVETVKIIVK